MTLKELQRRHESGEKQVKTVKAQIKAQLRRKCAQRGCNESLAFKSKVHTECPAHKGKTRTYFANPHKPTRVKKTKAQIKAANKKKKKAFYERHGIKFNKTIRNRVVDKLNKDTKGVLYNGQTLLYENYKEPLKAIEKRKGYGFYGTLAMTDDKQYVQCHICGHLFENVGGHLRIHKITAPDYKDRFELSQSTALVSEPVRERLQRQAVKIFDGKLPEHLVEYNRKVQSGEIKHTLPKRRTKSLEWRNKNGLCPDQVLDKIREHADELGRTPSLDEFQKRFGGKYIGSINFQHGSWLKAVAKLDMVSAKANKEYTREDLIEKLQEFHKEHNRIPMTSDFSRGLLPARNTYFHKFGTLNNARIEAGLNAVLSMPFGQVIELTPEEYFKYQEGHAIPGKIGESAIARRQYRKNKKKEVISG